jgi:hypothetical protein
LGCLGEIERAQALVEEFWPIFQAPLYQYRLKKVLGFLALLKGEAQEAAGHYRESVRHAHSMGYRLDALLALEGYAWVLCRMGQPTPSARLLGAAGEFRARSGAQVFPRDRPMYDQVVADMKSQLGEEAYAAAWAEGEAAGFDQLIAEVLAEAQD